MILIHTALQSEAQSLIELYKLTKTLSKPKIYENEAIILVISGIGEDNTNKALDIVFDKYNIKKAFNIGIAGCNDNLIKIGTIICPNQNIHNMQNLPLLTSNNIATSSDENTTTLYDMEGEYFYKRCIQNLEDKNIFIFKVVSDYLDDTIPSKEFVKQLIYQNLKSITKWI